LPLHLTETPPLGLFNVNEAEHFTSSELCLNVFQEFGSFYEYSQKSIDCSGGANGPNGTIYVVAN
jgi:hypothetical protein